MNAGPEQSLGKSPLGPGGLVGWTLRSTPPAGWNELLRAVGGGFFHSPAAFSDHEGPGDPTYAVAMAEGVEIALAVGLRKRCRLSPVRRHVRLLSPPAIAAMGEAWAPALLVSLCARLRADGAAVAVVNSFDAAFSVEEGGPLEPGPRRVEFRVPIGAELSEEAILARMHPSHRRKITVGEEKGWTLRPLQGEAAREVLARVQSSAARRRAALDLEAFDPPARRRIGSDGLHRDNIPPWGVQVFSATDGAETMAATLVGWGGARAFYLSGGSTPLGYERAATFWLQWRIMLRLRRAGLALYNLGGVPAEAERHGHPQHGLYRFKEGFAGERVICRGGVATLRPGHARLHAAVRRLGALLTRPGLHG